MRLSYCSVFGWRLRGKLSEALTSVANNWPAGSGEVFDYAAGFLHDVQATRAGVSEPAANPAVAPASPAPMGES